MAKTRKHDTEKASSAVETSKIDGPEHHGTSVLDSDEQLLKLVFDCINDGLCVLDTDYNILLVNRCMEKAYASEMPLVGRKCYEVYHGIDGPCRICPTRSTYKTGKSAVEEVPYESAGKQLGWIELSSHPMTNAEGKLTGVIEYVKYVTDRRNAQVALHASEEKYRGIFENAVAGLYRTSLDDGLVLDANDSFARMYGYAGRGDLVGKVRMAASYVNPAERKKLIEDCARKNGPVTYESLRYRKDGSVFWIRGSARLNADEQCLEGVATDITAQKLAEGNLRLTRFAMDNAWEAAYLLDKSGRFVYVNDAACAMYGYDREEILSMKVVDTDAGRSPSDTWEADWNASNSKEGITKIKTKRRKNQTVFPVELTMRHVVFDDAEYRCVFARDITERMALEEQLRQAQKMEAVGRLAGGVAHDFNNILQGILGTAELGLTDVSPGDRVYKDLVEIRRGAQRAAELTNQLLAFSRRQALQARDVDLNGVIEDTLKMLKRILPENITINMMLAKPLPAVSADTTQMQQVLLNLCINARDAMPKGGVLTIETNPVEITEACCQVNLSKRPGRYVLLSVSDNGVGMDQETLAHVFEPFFTTKEAGRGTGLGLATVYGIIKQHNGLITAYSEVGSGTVIKTYLPALDRPAVSPGARPREAASGGTETILVAEDQQSNKDIAKKVLERSGYRVVTASDGKEAVSVFEENSGKVDLVFMDLVMPGMSGHDAFLKMRETKPGLKGIFTTGYSVNALDSNLSDCAGLTIIAKPYTSTEILHAIRKTLDAKE